MLSLAGVSEPPKSPADPPGRLLCLGLGYTATRLALRLHARGFEVVGTTRDPEAKVATLPASAAATRPWELVAFDGSAPLPTRALAGVTHVVHSIRPDPDDPVLRHHPDFTVELPGLRWAAYLSTTGVYGDHGGAWVDEDSPRRPSKERTRRRVAAEDRWLAAGAHVFRLAGIYGPRRSALERVESGRARRVVKAGKVFNRIHVDDIVEVLVRSIDGPRRSPRAYNLSDGQPCSSAEVIEYAAQLLGVDPPPAVAFEDAELSPMARSFWSDNLRVANTRIREELGVELRYPDYRAGLDACLAARSKV